MPWPWDEDETTGAKEINQAYVSLAIMKKDRGCLNNCRKGSEMNQTEINDAFREAGQVLQRNQLLESRLKGVMKYVKSSTKNLTAPTPLVGSRRGSQSLAKTQELMLAEKLSTRSHRG